MPRHFWGDKRIAKAAQQDERHLAILHFLVLLHEGQQLSNGWRPACLTMQSGEISREAEGAEVSLQPRSNPFAAQSLPLRKLGRENHAERDGLPMKDRARITCPSFDRITER